MYQQFSVQLSVYHTQFAEFWQMYATILGVMHKA